MIEQAGFYETRGGELRYAVGRIPDGTASSSQWVVINRNSDVFAHMSSGHYYSDKTEDEDDLIRYLPTVSSWNDPIPPDDPPTVTVHTEWLSVVPADGTAWARWTVGDEKPCYAVAKLRTIEVPANG